jgi:hypothetical protein
MLSLPLITRVVTVTPTARFVGTEWSLPRTAASWARVGATASKVGRSADWRIPSI